MTEAHNAVVSRAGSVAAAFALIATACTSGAVRVAHTPAATPAPNTTTTSAPTPARPARVPSADTQVLRGHGELSLISAGRLYLAGGAAGGLRHVPLPGLARAPAWSPDHRWLSVLVSDPPRHPYAYKPASLFVLGADGHGVRRVTPTSRDVTDAAWSPTADELAVASYERGGNHKYRVDLLTPTAASRRTVVQATYISGLAWSPGGTELAIGAPNYINARPEGSRWSGDVLVVDSSTGARRTVVAARGAVLDLAGWTRDGGSIFYWPDPMGSGSIQADGLPLYAVPADGGTPHRLRAGGLVHQSWLARAPDGESVAIVGGGLRDIWGGHKHVVVCHAGARCLTIGQPRNSVSLWPAWAPDGTLAFARLPGGEFATGFGPPAVARWTSRSHLFEVRPGGQPALVPGVPVGATAPAYGADGTLLFIRGSSIWLKSPHERARRAVIGVAGLAATTFFGFVPYRQRLAWTDERPGSFAGTT